jgi:hypothetical protein
MRGRTGINGDDFFIGQAGLMHQCIIMMTTKMVMLGVSRTGVKIKAMKWAGTRFNTLLTEHMARM